MVERYPRIVEHLIGEELLAVFPALLLVGARGSGKSTSAAMFAETTVDLSVPGPRRAAREDPDGVLAACEGTTVIDEWQEAPEIVGAVKRAVDAETAPTPGRFIITGSARAAHQATTWPGTGRLIRVRMYGLTQSEIEHDNSYNPIDALFAADPPVAGPSDLTRRDYLERIVAGRFPYALSLTGRSLSRWYGAYVEQLAELDAPQIAAGNPRPSNLRAVLASCAARTGQELNKEATVRDAGISRSTADTYLRLLEDLSIVTRVPAWHTKRLYRLTRSPKMHLVDPGMAAYLLRVDAAALARDASLVGQLFETFVATELLAHIETAADDTSVHHFRDRSGHEIDFLLERGDRFVGIEVKSSASTGRADAKSLLWLRDRLGDRFHLGAVLYSGTLPFELHDRIWALPISALWRAPR